MRGLAEWGDFGNFTVEKEGNNDNQEYNISL